MYLDSDIALACAAVQASSSGSQGNVSEGKYQTDSSAGKIIIVLIISSNRSMWYAGADCMFTSIHCVPIKNVPDVFDCNLKTDDLILILFNTNILYTTGHETTI